MVEGEEWARLAPDLHERVARRHPGAIGREQNLFRWIGGLVPDLSDENKGRRFLLHRDEDGTVDGTVVFRIGDGASWDDGATVVVGDLLAANDVVEAALVRFLCEIDFVTEVEVPDQPAAWTVPWSLTDTRAASSGPVRDALQVRLHDVEAALSARSYAVPASLVLEVSDPTGADVRDVPPRRRGRRLRHLRPGGGRQRRRVDRRRRAGFALARHGDPVGARPAVVRTHPRATTRPWPGCTP